MRDLLSGQAPFILRLARSMMRRRYRGGTRLLHVANQLRLLDRVVSYPLGSGIIVEVPVSRVSSQWDDTDIALYEHPFIDAFVQAARALPPPVHFIDCGADI